MLFHSIQGAGGFSSGSAGVQFFASSTSSATTITLPSNLTSQDLLVLFDFSYGTGGTTYVLPSGWTAIANETDTYGGSGQTRAATSYRVGSSGLSGTSVTGMAAGTSGGVQKICVVFRNAAYSSVVTNTAYDSSSQAATGTLNAGTTPYLGLAFVAGSGTASLPTVPSGGSYTPASTGTVFCYYTLNGGAGTYTTNDSGTVTALKLLTLNVTNI